MIVDRQSRLVPRVGSLSGTEVEARLNVSASIFGVGRDDMDANVNALRFLAQAIANELGLGEVTLGVRLRKQPPPSGAGG